MHNGVKVEVHGTPDIKKAPDMEIDSLARLVLEMFIEKASIETNNDKKEKTK